MFPGVLAMVLAGIGVVTAPRRLRWLYVAVALVALDLTAGTNGRAVPVAARVAAAAPRHPRPCARRDAPDGAAGRVCGLSERRGPCRDALRARARRCSAPRCSSSSSPSTGCRPTCGRLPAPDPEACHRPHAGQHPGRVPHAEARTSWTRASMRFYMVERIGLVAADGERQQRRVFAGLPPAAARRRRLPRPPRHRRAASSGRDPRHPARAVLRRAVSARCWPRHGRNRG